MISCLVYMQPYKHLLTSNLLFTVVTMAQKTLLFLGAGPNVGAATLSLFKTRGYNIAAVARTIKPDIEANADICLTADFSDPSVVEQIFEKVGQKLGVPNVVVYNRK
jgi:NAD(P)-dependent dehydrogenase (short-subunit alcohol dehydrogenase family)